MRLTGSGLGSGLSGLGFRGLGFRVFGFIVWVFRVQGLGFLGLGFRGLGFRVWVFGVQGFGLSTLTSEFSFLVVPVPSRQPLYGWLSILGSLFGSLI